MSRERPREKRRAAPAGAKRAAPAHASGRRRWLAPLIVVLAAALVGAAWWLSRPAAPAGPQKSLAASQAAAQRGNQLVREKRFREAQAAYREAVALAPGEYWQLHFTLGANAAQISVENTSRAGISQPYAVSSIERVAAMREAVAEFEQAQRLADTPQALATIYATRAETYFTWGQMWDALHYFEAAAQADSGNPARVRRAAGMAQLMSHPEKARTLEEEMQRARAGGAAR